MMLAMPDRQPPGHGVLAQAAISRTPPELNGIKWQQMALFTKIRIWDVAISYKKAVQKWRDVCKNLQKPDFPWSNSAIFRESTCPPSSSPQRGSRALTMRQHG